MTKKPKKKNMSEPITICFKKVKSEAGTESVLTCTNVEHLDQATLLDLVRLTSKCAGRKRTFEISDDFEPRKKHCGETKEMKIVRFTSRYDDDDGVNFHRKKIRTKDMDDLHSFFMDYFTRKHRGQRFDGFIFVQHKSLSGENFDKSIVFFHSTFLMGESSDTNGFVFDVKILPNILFAKQISLAVIY
jgi:hypothetical protein